MRTIVNNISNGFFKQSWIVLFDASTWNPTGGNCHCLFCMLCGVSNILLTQLLAKTSFNEISTLFAYNQNSFAL